MALLALCIWPVIALIIAARVPRPAALVWMVILPYLFLPERFRIDLPGLPAFQKETVIAGSLILAFALIAPPSPGPRLAQAPQQAVPAESLRWLKYLVWICIAVLIAGSAVTISQNTAPIPLLEGSIPGTKPRDMLPRLLEIVVMLTPFFLARKYLVTPEDHQTLFRACVIMGLIYTLFMLIELRLSPQFHNWIYGFHQHSFVQHVRSGFRPKVFLPHGLEVGFFMLVAVMSALALWKQTQQPKWLLAVAWLGLILLLSRNLGALMVTIVIATVLMLNLPRLIRGTVIGVCLLLLSYPFIRASALSPVGPVLNLAEMISEQRAESFAFRLYHEDSLLEKAMERPLFGWGSWGRNRIYDEFGRDLSVTDGLWIIQVGSWGWVGYLCLFLIICTTLLVVAWQARRKPVSPVVAGMMLITAGNLIYIIPNSIISPVVWLMIGALFGYALRRGADVRDAAPDTGTDTTAPQRARAAFSRFPTKVRQNGRMVPQPPSE